MCDGSETKLHIAIDGPAASGKSTVGRALAATLGWRYLDTGLMYRAVTRAALECGVDLSDGRSLSRLAQSLSFALQPSGLHVDGKPADDSLRTAEVDGAVSEVSAHPLVRRVLVERQRALGRDGRVVMVGRDIGTVVLPAARLKIFLTASEQERARRRASELKGALENDLPRELTRISTRDSKDSTRAASPLRIAEDAVVINTDGLSQNEVVRRVVREAETAFPDLLSPRPRMGRE